MLWKEAWALSVLALALIGIERRWFVPVVVLDIVLALSHKTTAVVYIASLCVLFAIDRSRRRESLLHALMTGACLLAVGLPALHSAFKAPPQAIFLDLPGYIGLSFPLIILIIFGYKVLTSARIPRTIMALGVASVLFILFHSPFYERVFVFLDIALAVCAGYALEQLLSRIDLEALTLKGITSLGVACVALGLLCGALWIQVHTLRPLMTHASINIIVDIGIQVPREATILTTSDEAPWFEGWTLAHIAAPGMLRDTHNLEEWITFWSATSSPEKISFLNELPRPLYISTLGDVSDLLGSSTIPCLQKISEHLLYDACK